MQQTLLLKYIVPTNHLFSEQINNILKKIAQTIRQLHKAYNNIVIAYNERSETHKLREDIQMSLQRIERACVDMYIKAKLMTKV
jgi:soluble P-type ATPase